MQQVKERFQTLLQGNWSPASADDHFDAAVLPILVAAENARSPKLNLQLLGAEENFAAWLLRERPKKARVMFAMPGLEPHIVTADIRRIDGKTSVVIIEPLGMSGDTRRKYEQVAIPTLKSALSSDVVLSVLALNTQKSTNDCRVFALSAASKLVDHAGYILKHHRRNVDGRSLKTSSGQKADILAGDGNVKVVEGVGTLPLAFAKHSQSSTTVGKWLKASPRSYAKARVNKGRQSIEERYQSKTTTRYEAPVNARFMMDNLADLDMEVPVRSQVFSKSIEEKRLTYLDRAIEYLRHAPESECSKFLESMAVLENAHPGPGTSNLSLDDRDWGPHPNTLRG